jgi:hypothetical protein
MPKMKSIRIFDRGEKATVQLRARLSVFAGLFLGIAAIACGPEPTTPATTNLAGSWTANAHLFALSNFRIEMIQEPNGIVSGKWFADGSGGGGGCLPAVPCKAFGNLIGTNTVSQVAIELLGAGRFDGVLLNGTTLRGTFSVTDNYDSITFVRKSATPSLDRLRGE